MSIETERETQLYKAKLAELAERFEDMVEHMKKIAQLGVELTSEEMGLLAFAYKNLIRARQASWRTISSIEQETSKENQQRINLIKGYREKLEEEICKISNDMLTTIDQHLIPTSNSVEAIVFYHRLKGDYFRYLANIKFGREREETAEQALKEYEAATAIADTDLHPTDSVRLGLALNLAVLHSDIMNSCKRARQVAKKAYDEAISKWEDFDEESQSYRDSTILMQLLRENIKLWNSYIYGRIRSLDLTQPQANQNEPKLLNLSKVESKLGALWMKKKC